MLLLLIALSRTMQMMYTIVADAIKDHEVDAKPTDYLMFFCLAKREGMNDIPEDIGPPAPGTKAELVRQECACVRYSGRFEPTTSDRSSRKMGTQIHNFRIFFVPGGFSARDYGMAAFCSLSVVCVCVCLHHEISTELSLRLV